MTRKEMALRATQDSQQGMPDRLEMLKSMVREKTEFIRDYSTPRGVFPEGQSFGCDWQRKELEALQWAIQKLEEK